MEEKIFNLIESMYSEMNKRFDGMQSDMNKRFDEVNIEIAKNREGITRNREEITRNRTSIAALESKLGDRIDALLDGYKFNTEVTQRNARDIKRVEDKVDALALRVDRHEEEIAALKSAK